jgi:hypothetical protein
VKITDGEHIEYIKQTKQQQKAMVKTLANFKEVSKSNKNVKLTWFETKI